MTNRRLGLILQMYRRVTGRRFLRSRLPCAKFAEVTRITKIEKDILLFCTKVLVLLIKKQKKNNRNIKSDFLNLNEILVVKNRY